MRITRSQLKRIINEEVRNYPSVKRSLREDLGETSAGAWAEWAESCAEEMAKAVPTPTAKGGSDPEREEETKTHGLDWNGNASTMKLNNLVNWITDSSGDLMIGKGGPEFTVEEAKKVSVDVEFPDGTKKGKIGKRAYEERQALARFITKWSNILWATQKFMETSSNILNSYGRKITLTTKNFIFTEATGAQLSDLLGDANSKETAAEWISIVEPKLLEITKDNLDISEDAKGLKPEAMRELQSALKDLRGSVIKELAAAGYKGIQGIKKESRARSQSPGSEIIVERWQKLAGILKG